MTSRNPIAVRALVLGLLLMAAMGSAGHCAVETVQFSSDGNYLAALTPQGTLYVVETNSGNVIYTLPHALQGAEIAWRPGANQIAVVLDEGEGWDIYLLDLEGNKLRLTAHPAKDYCPQWSAEGKSLVFVSDRKENADIYELPMEDPLRQAKIIVDRPFDQYGVRVQPGGHMAAYLSLENGEVEAWIAAPGQEPHRVGSLDPLHQFGDVSDLTWDASGQYLCFVEQAQGRMLLHAYDVNKRRTRLLLDRSEILRPLWDEPGGDLYYESGGRLRLRQIDGLGLPGILREKKLDLHGLALGKVSISGKGGEGLMACRVEDRGAALGNLPGDNFRLLFLDLETDLYYAEALYGRGKTREAESVYQQILALARDDADARRVNIHHAQRLRRAGKPSEALKALERAAASSATEAETAGLYALQGEILFFELGRLDQAQALFHRADAFTPADALQSMEPLQILLSNDASQIDWYARAHRALWQGRPRDALGAMRKLAERYPQSPLIRGAILELLGNPGEAEWIAPPPNPFEDSANLDRVVSILKLLDQNPPEIAPESSEEEALYYASVTERIRHQLLQTLLRARRYSDARQLALEIINQNGMDALGVIDFLRYYIETDRSDPDAEQFLGQVLLEPSLANILLQSFIADPVDEALLYMARCKLAMAQGNRPEAANLLEKTRGVFEAPVRPDERDGLQHLRYYFYFLLARYSERLTQWDRAEDAHRRALADLAEYSPERVDTAQEIVVALETLKAGRGNEKALQQLLDLQRKTGVELLNLSADPLIIRQGVAGLLGLLRAASPSPLDTFILYQAGRTLSRSSALHGALHYYDRALRANPPTGVRAAILSEKANILQQTANVWQQGLALESMLKLDLSPPQRESVLLRQGATLLELNLEGPARKILEKLRDEAVIPVFGESAAQLLESYGMTGDGAAVLGDPGARMRR